MKNIKKQATKLHYLLIVIFCLGAVACNNDDDNGNPIDDEISDQDRNFAMNATFSNLAEIEMGELAASKGNLEAVRAFGEMMVTEHTTAQNRLETITDSLDITIPDTLKTEHRIMHEQLSALSGEAFDSAYIMSQVIAHEQAEQIFATQDDDGENDALEDYAEENLPHIRMHLQRAREIRDNDLGLGDN